MFLRTRGARRRRVVALQHALALDATTAAELASRLAVRAVGRNEIVIRSGDPAGEAYVIVAGFVEIATSETDDGRPRGLRMLPPGRLFGEMAVLERTPRRAWAVARAAGELLVLTPADLIWLRAERPEVRAHLDAQLTERRSQLATPAS